MAPCGLKRHPSPASCSRSRSNVRSSTFLFALQCAGKYTVKADYEKAGAQELMVRSGEMVELIKQEDDGQW